MKTRVLVRDTMTGLYLKRLGSWTQHETEAFSFSQTATALLFCLRHDLSMTQVILRFGEEQYDIEFVIPDNQLLPARRPVTLMKG